MNEWAPEIAPRTSQLIFALYSDPKLPNYSEKSIKNTVETATRKHLNAFKELLCQKWLKKDRKGTNEYKMVKKKERYTKEVKEKEERTWVGEYCREEEMRWERWRGEKERTRGQTENTSLKQGDETRKRSDGGMRRLRKKRWWRWARGEKMEGGRWSEKVRDERAEMEERGMRKVK